jgi:hypothetical protein
VGIDDSYPEFMEFLKEMKPSVYFESGCREVSNTHITGNLTPRKKKSLKKRIAEKSFDQPGSEGSPATGNPPGEYFPKNTKRKYQGLAGGGRSFRSFQERKRLPPCSEEITGKFIEPGRVSMNPNQGDEGE